MEKEDYRQAPRSGTSYTVKAGDTLSKIAEKYYGDAAKFEVIFEANKDILKSANEIKVGQELKIPPKK